jgi:amino acid transporter/nucleotide-binding universal stress UspA family protein
VSSETAAAPAAPAVRPSVEARQLTWLLAWAVVFCDIGTSVYYVPGILYEQVGELAPLFVAMVSVGFVLLALKYVEICWRNREGGGVVSVATKAFGPRWGALGGMLITVDYFLTSSISATSAFYYVGSLFPAIEAHVVGIASAGILALGMLNVIGIRESATVSLCMAVSALTVDLWVVGQVLWAVGPKAFVLVREAYGHAGELEWTTALIGFSGAWLAFSGLESIAQLAPAMREPIGRTSRVAMIAVIATVLLTSPVLTLFSVGLLDPANGAVATERFISELGGAVGGTTLKLAVILTATTLLLFAANTAMIGGYHIFLALANQGFLPKLLTWRNRTFGTPHVAIAVTTFVPILVITGAQGDMVLLGQLYAFGLLGDFVLSSLGLDVIRWRLQRRGVVFWLGLVVTAMLALAFSVNLVAKPLATVFGGGITALGMMIAIGMREGFFTEALYRVPFVGRLATSRAAAAERDVESDEQLSIVSLGQAVELRPLFPSSTLLAIRGRAVPLLREAAARVKGRGESVLYCVFVDELPGLFLSGEPPDPNPEAEATLRAAVQEGRRLAIEVIPIWMVSFSAAEAIARAAERLEVDGVIVGVSRRNALYRLLRGQVVKGLAKRLPKSCHLILCN